MEDARIKSLITRYLTNEATELEQEKLLEWVSLDDTHHQIFAQYVRLWEKKIRYPEAFNLSIAQQKLNYKIDQAQREETPAASPFSIYKIAAAIAFVLIASATLYISTISSSTPIPLVVKQTKNGERLTLTLADGTRIKLNSGSTLSYPEKFGKQREVSLHGEAFFEVAHDSKRPFVITTGAVKTKVLGTSFNIHQDSSKVVVTVATGKVEVTHDNASELLLPNEKVSFNAATGTLAKSEANLERDLAWRNNTLIFEDTNLLETSLQLQKWFGVSFRFTNAATQACVISAKYHNQSLTSILNSISFSTGVKAVVQNNEVVFSGTGCK